MVRYCFPAHKEAGKKAPEAFFNISCALVDDFGVTVVI